MIAVDTVVPGVSAAVTTDNVAAGRMACDYLARRLGGSGQVAIIDGHRVSAVADRISGCRAALKHYASIQVVSAMPNGQGQRSGGAAAMSTLLGAGVRIDGVFAINDPTAFGAEDIILKAGRGHIPIASVDGSPGVEERLKDSNSLIEISVAQLPDRMAAEALYEAIRLAAGTPPPPAPVLLEPKPVTKSTVSIYHGWKW